MIGGGAAAATDEGSAGGDHVAGDGGEIFGGGEVDVAAVVIFGKARVGKGREGERGDPGHSFQHPQQLARAAATVGAKTGGSGGGKAADGGFGTDPVAGPSLLEKGHLRQGR